MTASELQQLLTDIARAKAAFQQRTIAAIMEAK